MVARSTGMFKHDRLDREVGKVEGKGCFHHWTSGYFDMATEFRGKQKSRKNFIKGIKNIARVQSGFGCKFTFFCWGRARKSTSNINDLLSNSTEHVQDTALETCEDFREEIPEFKAGGEQIQLRQMPIYDAYMDIAGMQKNQYSDGTVLSDIR